MLGGRATARPCQTTPALEQASAGTRRLAATHGGLTSHDLDLVNTGIVPHRAGAVTEEVAQEWGRLNVPDPRR
jgi:hypothetical protein